MHLKRPPGQLNAPAESLQVGFYKSVTDRSTDGWADGKMDWPIYGQTPSYARCDYVFKNEIIEPKMPALFIDKGWPNLHYLIRSPCLWRFCLEMMEIGYSKSFRSLGAILLLLPPSTVKPITWEWSHFEDILEENTLNSQNEGWGPLGSPTGAVKDQNWPKSCTGWSSSNGK